MVMSLEEFAIKKQKELWNLWDAELRENFPLGFKMTTSPVLDSPKVIIIGRNPGNSEDPPHSHMEQFEPPNQSFGFSQEHDYRPGGAGYTIANEIRNLVFTGQEDLLNQTIETNLDFLRTDDWDDIVEGLGAIEKDGREDVVEDYRSICRTTIRRFIEQGDPDVVISYIGNRKDNYPLDEIITYIPDEPTCNERYSIERGNRHKDGSYHTREYRVTHAEFDTCKFIGITPHLSNPNIPTPVRKVFKQNIPPKLPDS